ncbi:hypothetical protein DY000_02059444 [Brassica cretica]|uniref:Uncharacterized protein n=1 Tax=Brassica cretica TaxID=69181 RepID=A0ABQ7AZA7_BRACR|nr:hypothetical protein DY000_02059444 [Brassica cretica]
MGSVRRTQIRRVNGLGGRVLEPRHTLMAASPPVELPLMVIDDKPRKDIVEKDLSPKESPRESETERSKADAVEIMDTPADLVDTPARIGDDVEHVENSVDYTGEELVVASQSDLAESPDANSWSLVSLGKTGRQCEKVQDQTVISPSRFHLLADDVP